MSRHGLHSVTASAVAAVSGSFPLDLELSLRRIERIIRDARARGAELIVFPEGALGGYPCEADGGPLAPVTKLSRDCDVFHRVARAAGPAVVCVGYTEAAPDGPFASAVCLSGDGILGHHRKVHVPPAERGLLRPGDGFAAFDTPVGRLGMLICYDKVFPGGGAKPGARRRGDNRLDGGVAGVPTAAGFGHPRGPSGPTLQRTRYGACGREPGRVGIGQSLWLARSTSLPRPGQDRGSRRSGARGDRGAPWPGARERRFPRRRASHARRAIPSRGPRRGGLRRDLDGARRLMCGIAGRLGPKAPGEDERLLVRLAHRGPDDAGEVHFAGGWLGHRRLSIVDVEGGRQPLRTSDGERWLVGNGEIYNHDDVRRDLGGDGYATRSDNEVALRLLEQRGPASLGQLEGMYALLSATADGRSFVAARDPVGIKPLYWARRGRSGSVRLGDVGLRSLMAPGGRGVPARALLDARARAAALRGGGSGGNRDRRPAGARARGPRGDAGGPDRVGAPADDGRRSRRRVPLRRARLLADRGDRRQAVRPRRESVFRRSPSGWREARTCWPRARRPST